MLINEIFDSPYQLKTDTPQTKRLTKHLRSSGHGLNGLIVYQVADDPYQLFILVKASDGLWEVHHVTTYGGEYSSGEIKPQFSRSAANPRFISTALSLYQSRLDKGHGIRVVAGKDSGFWPTYQRVIDRMVKNSDGNLIAEPLDTNFTSMDGQKCIAQVVKPKGKFHEMFKNFKPVM
jgi:hypothetical protein